MKENFEGSKKLNKEDSLGDYQAVLDHSIVNGEMRETRDRKEILKQSIRDIEVRPEVADFFFNKSEVLVIEDEISRLTILIKNTIENPNSSISKEDLDIAIQQLRNHEDRLKTLNKEVQSMTENNIHVKSAFMDIKNLQDKIKLLDAKAEEIVRLYESNQRKSRPEDTTMSLN